MDVTENTDIEAEFDPVEALTKAWEEEDAAQPSDTSDADNKQNDPPAEDEADTSDEEVQDDEGQEDGAEEDEGQSKEDKSYADDEVFVKVKVDGEEREFAVKDLKRLAGQEASLTRKSQEVADLRKAVDTENQVNTARVNGLLQRALERWKPYENVNLLVAAKQLEPDQLQALQTEMQARWDDIQFLTQEQTALTTQAQQTAHTAQIEAAKACIKTLTDPATGIEGWSSDLYADLCGYAKQNGVGQELVNGLTDPGAFKVIHKAMLYDKAQKTVQNAKDKQGKQKKAPPKKIVKGNANAGAVKGVLKPSKAEEATRKLRQTGDRDDATDALLAMWADSND